MKLNFDGVKGKYFVADVSFLKQNGNVYITSSIVPIVNNIPKGKVDVVKIPLPQENMKKIAKVFGVFKNKYFLIHTSTSSGMKYQITPKGIIFKFYA